MAGNKKNKRKPMTGKRKPRPVWAFGGLHAIGQQQQLAAPLTDEEQTKISIAYLDAIEAIIGGRAEHAHFDTLVYGVNIGALLLEQGIGTEHEQATLAALEAMRRCRQRYDDNGIFGLDGDGVRALREFSAIHEAIAENLAAGELESAVREMNRRNAEKKRLQAEAAKAKQKKAA